MLLDEFDHNPNFHGWSDKIITEFEGESISLQLDTDQGCQPLDGDHMIGGHWKLSPMHNLTVSITPSNAHV